jgi:mRNA-degrading endonuclease RelE of RelBE toxin-antitoxin system
MKYTIRSAHFIELNSFTKHVYDYLSDEAYGRLQDYLILHPESGDMIPGTGGCRKLRWSVAGRGKRGGVRVIYYYRRNNGQIWMMTIYAKNEMENIPMSELRALRQEIDTY